MNPYTILKKALHSKTWKWPITIAIIIYLVCPIDLIPEIFVPLVGYIDDGVLLAILVTELFLDTRTGEEDKKSNKVIDVESKKR